MAAACCVVFICLFAATPILAQCSTETVIFDAERVWKGPLTEQTTIYRPVPVSGDNVSPLIVEITVDETGRVSRATVLRSVPLLDQAAIDCVMKWEYLPALINGAPQPVTMTDRVRFAP